MSKKKQNSSRTEKNQLIAKPPATKWSPFVALVVRPFGWVFLILGLAGGLAIALWCFLPNPPTISTLQDWANFGQAIAGSFALATLGTIILSFEYVSRQLKLQVHTEETRYQPVVACAALLDYRVQGVDSEDRVTITNPQLKLELENLGDSPATFVDIKFEELLFIAADKIDLHDRLKSNSIQIDYIGARLSGDSDEQHYARLMISDELPSEVADLIDGILGRNNPLVGQLKLRLNIRHENVMGLEYTRQGTFIWSSELKKADRSDHLQIDYIESFQSAREKRHTFSIGHYIMNSEPIQAALEPKIQKRWYQFGLG